MERGGDIESPRFLWVAALTIAVLAIAVLAVRAVLSYPNGVRLWRYVAAAALVLSFVPDVLLAGSHGMGGGWPEACALMVMHVVVWAVCVTLLPALAYTTRRSTGSRHHDGLSIR